PRPNRGKRTTMLDVVQRHRCRNPKCRAKLTRPVENEHHAFCTRGCHKRFYRSRCLVCEEPFRRKNERQRFGSGHKVCQTEYRRFPHVYDYQADKKAYTPSNARRSQEVPILRALNSASAGILPAPIVFASGGGAIRSMATYPSTTKMG